MPPRAPEIRRRLRSLLRRLNVFDPSRPMTLDDRFRAGDHFDKSGGGSRGM
jgi:hypothetical protein